MCGTTWCASEVAFENSMGCMVVGGGAGCVVASIGTLSEVALSKIMFDVTVCECDGGAIDAIDGMDGSGGRCASHWSNVDACEGGAE